MDEIYYGGTEISEVYCGSTLIWSADKSISISSRTWSPTYSSSSKSITVTSRLSWSATASANWITVGSPSNNTVTISVGQNSGAARTGTVTFTNGSGTTTLTINQGAAPNAEISVTIGGISYSQNTTTYISADYGSYVDITISSNYTWSASGTSSNFSSYFKLSSYNGWIRVTSKTNNTGSSNISGTVVISNTAGGSITVYVVQSYDSVSLSPSSWSPTYSANNKSITVTASRSNWSASVDSAYSSWLSCSKSGNTLAISVTTNTDTTSRSGSIIVTSGLKSATFTVNQGAAPSTHLTVSSNSITFEPDGKGTIVSITVSSNYTWSIKSNSNTTNFTATKYNNSTLRVTAAKNNTGSTSITGTVVLQNGYEEQTINVTQYYDYITVSPSSWTSTYAAESKVFTVTSYRTWSCTSSVSWITAVKGSNNLTVYVDENTSTSSRFGSVTITSGYATYTLNIGQNGVTIVDTTMTLTCNNSELSDGDRLTLSYAASTTGINVETNVAWSNVSVTVVDGSDWITVSKRPRISVATITVTENTTGLLRLGSVRFVAQGANNSVTKTIEIVQQSLQSL